MMLGDKVIAEEAERIEQNNGSFKKASFEAINYASKIAASAGTQVCAVVLGEANDTAILGNYGAN
ncbi:unnamed protein product, partial [Darwinula stevensoni]